MVCSFSRDIGACTENNRNFNIGHIILVPTNRIDVSLNGFTNFRFKAKERERSSCKRASMTEEQKQRDRELARERFVQTIPSHTLSINYIFKLKFTNNRLFIMLNTFKHNQVLF